MMKVHSDTACVAVDAQVARLEAAIRAKDAALRESKWWLDHWGEEYAESFRSLLKAKQMLRAALLPDAGKGWLPPEASPRG